MKKFLLAAVAFAAIGAAQAQSFYVQGNFGPASMNVDCAGALTCDDKSSGFKLIGGYNVLPGIAAEVAIANYGKFNSSFDDGVDIWKYDLKTSSIKVGASFSYALTDSIKTVARLGASVNKFKITETVSGMAGSASASKTSTQPYFGLGISYDITKDVAVALDYDVTKFKFDGESANAKLLSAGVRYSF